MDNKRDMKGEGDRESDRNYREKTEQFIESGKVDGAAQEAKRAYEEDPEELEAAEEAAKADAATRIDASNDAIAARMTELSALRETLRLKMHLAKKDAQDLFAAAEEKWDSLTGKASTMKDTSKESAENIKTASKMVIDEIQESYKKLKALI